MHVSQRVLAVKFRTGEAKECSSSEHFICAGEKVPAKLSYPQCTDCMHWKYTLVKFLLNFSSVTSEPKSVVYFSYIFLELPNPRRPAWAEFKTVDRILRVMDSFSSVHNLSCREIIVSCTLVYRYIHGRCSSFLSRLTATSC